MLLLAIRFLLELAGLAALGVIGASTPGGTLPRVVLGLGLPLALGIVWGLVVAPKARSGLSQRTRQGIGTALLVGVSLALALAGQPWWGIGLAVVVLADHALIVLLGLEDPAAALGAFAAEAR